MWKGRENDSAEQNTSEFGQAVTPKKSNFRVVFSLICSVKDDRKEKFFVFMRRFLLCKEKFFVFRRKFFTSQENNDEKPAHKDGKPPHNERFYGAFSGIFRPPRLE